MFGSIKDLSKRTDCKDHAGLESAIYNTFWYKGLLHELESGPLFEGSTFDSKSCMMVSYMCKIIKVKGLYITERQLYPSDPECGMHSDLH